MAGRCLETKIASKNTMQNRIIYVMGVSGSGKSTIAQLLADALKLPFADADDFHPAANVEKMSQGIPLQDEDRQAWLEAIQVFAKKQLAKQGAVIACSALKEKYRQILQRDIAQQVDWVYLQGSYALIHERMQQRKDHFMPESLLQSQFATLEEPHNALVLTIEKPPEELLAEALGFFQN